MYRVIILIFNFCLDKWSPALQVRTVLLSIQALMGAPNPDDPLANDVAEHWKRDEKSAIEQGNNSNRYIYILWLNINDSYYIY